MGSFAQTRRNIHISLSYCPTFDKKKFFIQINFFINCKAKCKLPRDYGLPGTLKALHLLSCYYILLCLSNFDALHCSPSTCTALNLKKIVCQDMFSIIIIIFNFKSFFYVYILDQIKTKNSLLVNFSKYLRYKIKNTKFLYCKKYFCQHYYCFRNLPQTAEEYSFIKIHLLCHILRINTYFLGIITSLEYYKK